MAKDKSSPGAGPTQWPRIVSQVLVVNIGIKIFDGLSKFINVKLMFQIFFYLSMLMFLSKTYMSNMCKNEKKCSVERQIPGLSERCVLCMWIRQMLLVGSGNINNSCKVWAIINESQSSIDRPRFPYWHYLNNHSLVCCMILINKQGIKYWSYQVKNSQLFI